MDVSTAPNCQNATLCSDALCGSCPPSGSAPQANSIWPTLPPSGAGFPAWPGQPTQPAQPVPCWTGQPNSPCWPPGSQPAPSSFPAPIAYPAPSSFPAPISYPAPAQILTPTPAPAPTIIPAPAPAQVPAPVPVQPCNPYWPGPQCQPPQPPAPVQAQVPVQVPVPAPAPAPAPAPIITPHPVPAPGPAAGTHPNVPGWTAHPGWPYNPGQSGWPGQHPSYVPPHWPPPTSGPLSVPYNLNLARGVYDKMMMTILGHVKPNAKMFTVNFLRGNDIAFHINPRFSEGGKQVVVRNHKVGERWGSEERDLKGPFPFAQGSPFEANVWKRWTGLESRLCRRVLDKGAAVLQEGSWR